MVRRNRGLIFLFLLALFLRIAVVWYATLWRENTDVLRYRDWVRIGFTHNFAASYTQPELLTFGSYPNNQPPGTVYLLSLPYQVWLAVGKTLALFGVAPGSNQWVNGPLLNIFLRVPSLLADFVIGWLIYLIVLHYQKRKDFATLAASLFLFNPAIFYNSAFWGQMDAVNNALFLVALWLLFQGRFIWSAVFLASSFLIKFSLLFAVPLYALFAWFNLKPRKQILLGMIGTALGVTLLAILPLSGSPLSWYLDFVVKNASGEMLNITAFAFNFWWVIFRPMITFGPGPDLFSLSDIRLSGSPLTPTIFAGTTLGRWALVLFTLVNVLLYLVFIKKLNFLATLRTHKQEAEKARLLFGAVSAAAILAYLFLPQMHERYLYPAFASLAILIGLGVPVFWEFVILSICNFVNLLVVWHPMPLSWGILELMRSGSFQSLTALITTGVGIWVAIKLVRYIS